MFCGNEGGTHDEQLEKSSSIVMINESVIRQIEMINVKKHDCLLYTCAIFSFPSASSFFVSR